MLGPLDVVEGGAARPLGGAKQRAVLAVLLVHRGEVLSSERLIDELWGERPPASAAKTLQVYISHLRKALGDGVLLTRGRGYQLLLAPDQLDLTEFEALVDQGRHALHEGDVEAAAEQLRRALGLWPGAPLADFAYEPFAQAEIARLEEVRLGAVEDRIEADLAIGRHVEVVGELEDLVRDHPLRERLRAQLMLALYRSGRQADALWVHQAGRRALVDELGIEPGRQLRQLQQAILEQDPELDFSPSTVVESSPKSAFVGRDREVGELLSKLEDAFAGHGRLCLLVGEPGIGKSCLAEELVRIARLRAARVLVGRCWEAGGAPPFWPWVQSLRAYVREGDRADLTDALGPEAAQIAPILPELYELLPGLREPASPQSEGARFALFHAVAELLRSASEKRPTVLVLDDLHAADTPSLLLLRFLARELGTMHVLVLALMRDVDPTPDEALTTMLAELAREPVTRRLELGGWTEDNVARYLELTAAEIASAELAAGLYAETEGHPLFVCEAVRLLSLEGVEPARVARIPQTVRDVISRRLARLSPECNRLLEQASVLGREFALDGLALLAGVPQGRVLDALDEAVAARVVLEVPGTVGRLRFAHVLIRDTLYAGLTISRRVKLHRHAAAALKARYGDQEGLHLAQLAHQSIAGGDFEDGRVYAARAGDWAMGMFAYEEAERLYSSALDALERAGSPGPEVRCELLLSLGDAQARAGDSAAAQGTFLAASELARRLGLGPALARAAAGYGGRIVWARAGTDARLVPLLESGLAALSDDDLELRVRLLARLAGALRDEHSMERRLRMSREAVVLARRVGDPGVLAYALEGYGSVIGGRPGTDAEQTAIAAELVEAAGRAGDRERLVSGQYQRFIAAIGVGDVGKAEAALTAATSVAEELRQPVQLWQVCAARAMLSLAKGRISEAEELIERALTIGERAQRGMAIPTHTLQCYTLRDFQGRLPDIEPAIRAAVNEYESQPVYRCALVHLNARLSRTTEARRALAELARDDFAMLPRDNEWLCATSLLVEACSLVRDAQSAAVLYRLLAPYRTYNVVDTPDAIRGSVARYLGLLAETLGDTTCAATHYDDAIDMNASMGAAPWLAHTQSDYARLLLARDAPSDREQAEELLNAALVTYRELGMSTHAATTSAVGHSRRRA
jgi:DNA-binding SARP family transcriptional activator